MAFYDEEYREALAKKKDFRTYKEYSEYLATKRKEKLENIGKKTQIVLAKEFEEKERELEKRAKKRRKKIYLERKRIKEELQTKLDRELLKEKERESAKILEEERESAKILEEEKVTLLEMPQEERLKYFQEHKICQSLQRIVSETQDQESIFKDIQFIEEFTGCKIKKKKMVEKERI